MLKTTVRQKIVLGILAAAIAVPAAASALVREKAKPLTGYEDYFKNFNESLAADFRSVSDAMTEAETAAASGDFEKSQAALAEARRLFEEKAASASEPHAPFIQEAMAASAYAMKRGDAEASAEFLNHVRRGLYRAGVSSGLLIPE